MIQFCQRPGRAQSPSRQQTARAAFSLLEVLLALAISTVVIGALFMTIDLQLKIADESRLEVEEARLAHAILARISDDLRNSVVFREQDMSAAFTAVEGSSALAGALTESPDLVPLVPDNISPGNTEPADPADEEEVTPPNIPGVYGDSTYIQIDVSRIPRVDEYVSLVEQGPSNTAADLLSDIKTVKYYVLGQTNINVAQFGVQAGPTDDGQTGLFYSSADRAATAFADSYGNPNLEQQQGRIISERITLLEFEYFDGTEWVTQWDASDRQGNPVAVRVYLEMYPIDWEMMTEQQQRMARGAFPLYQTVVWLPTSEPTTAGAGSTTSSTSDDDSGSDDSGSDDSGSSSAGSSGGSTGGGAQGGGAQGGGAQGGAGQGGRP